MPIPEYRLAICKRCRWPERIAGGADSDDRLLEHAREWAAERDAHARRSQCLNCCDGGHTVRVEWEQHEVAIIGIRVVDELDLVLRHVDDIARLRIPTELIKRVYQVWIDGRMVYHRSLGDHEDFDPGSVG